MKDDSSEKADSLKKKIKKIKESSFFKEKEIEIKQLDKKIQEKDFWQKGKESVDIYQKFTQLKEGIDKIEKIEKELNQNSLSEEKFLSLEEEIRKEEEKIFLSMKYDKNPAILTIQAGTGGRDAEDWATLLLKMYQKWAENRRFKIRILSEKFGEPGGPDGRIGTKEVSLEINGRFAYGLLRRESGVHRLVRISPFSAKQLRHTSFAKVEVIPVIKEEELVLKPEELRIETFRSSGPGGQYVNKRESAVRIIHIPTGIKAESQVERLQGLNRKIAMNILISKIIKKRENDRENELKKLEGEKVSPDFGNQIRSYVFHPYTLVKDQRTGVETSNIEEVLNGKIDEFIDAEVKMLP